jgi:oligosaccharide repeat unit polymerase
MFSGKKSFALIFIVITICYYNFNVRALGLKFIVIFTPFIFAIIGLLIYTGSGLEDQNFEILLEYFNYAEIPAEFLYRHEEFGYYLGKAFLTSFWVLVPRSLYPEKPFEYGASLVHQIIHPGLAETGHTSGYFMWLSSYLDFGILGVIIAFSFQGWLSRTIFEWYLSHRDTLFSFILMMHFSLFEVWFFLPAPFAFLMCLVLALISSLFRKRSFGMIFPK